MKLYDFVESLASNPFLAQEKVEKHLKAGDDHQSVNVSQFIRNKITNEEGGIDCFACETKVVSWE